MKTLTKALTGTIAAGAMALSAAAPAAAQDYRNRDHNGISAGEVIAGAVVLGGIAAVVSSAGRNNGSYGYDSRYGTDNRDYVRSGYDSRYGYNDRDQYRGNPRQAIEICINAAEREAGRYGYSRANVTQVTDIRAKDWGYEVRGRIVVEGGRGGYDRGYNNGYGNSYGGDYNRGWGSGYNRGNDDGSFKCRFERGRIADLNLSGIRSY